MSQSLPTAVISEPAEVAVRVTLGAPVGALAEVCAPMPAEPPYPTTVICPR